MAVALLSRIASAVVFLSIFHIQKCVCKATGRVDIVEDLFVPPLEEVRDVLSGYLRSRFADVSVEVVQCPDLTKPPFYLAAPGFGGNAKAVDVGGDPYLVPLPQKNKKYDLAEVVSKCGSRDGFVIGPGAGPFYDLGRNCENMANVYFGTTPPKVGTHLAWIDKNNSYVSAWKNTTGFAFLGQFLLTDGQPSTPVLKIVAKQRITKNDFITSVKTGLEEKYANKSVGLGGVFVIKSGKIKMHVMPDFSPVPLNTTEDMDKWFRYFIMDPPLVCLSIFYSYDPGLDLRMAHSHCFSEHGQGGHYHYDVTPMQVEYEAYLTLAGKVYRLDKP